MTRCTTQVLWCWLPAVAMLWGCGGAQSEIEVRTSAHTGPRASAAQAASPPAQVDNDQIDRALSAAAALLAARQAADGAWRSDVYGPFKEGDALTAQVLMALVDTCTDSAARPHDHAIEKAIAYLAAMVDGDGTITPPKVGLAYPVYTAAGAATALSREADPRRRQACTAWVEFLRQRQLTEALGWQSDDAPYGGWGYAADPPRKPAPGEPLGNLAEPNLSATVCALEALRAAGVAADDPAVTKALAFVRRCQNSSDDPTTRDDAFDDGGFHFMLADPVRNKAGVAGTDRLGRTRLASYGSATADGLRALILCGVPADGPSVVAAWNWLERHFASDAHPGAYAADREGARAAVYFYYCHSLTQALAMAGPDHPAAAANRTTWARAIADALVARQKADGSWKNPAVDVREDDPLVATSLAASALARCRTILAVGR